MSLPKEGAWVQVRTDLFNPNVYLEIELYYKDLIQKIYDFGGYITFAQFIKLYEKSQGAGHLTLRHLIDDLKLLGEQQVNRNKYAYLKTRAMQYLKQNIKAKSVDTRPNNHVLLTSIYKAEFFLQKRILLRSEVNADGFTKLQEEFRTKFSVPEPFTNPSAFINEINNLHYSRCFTYKTQKQDMSLAFNFAVIDFDRSKTWYLNLLNRLDSLMVLLNDECSYSIDILVKNNKRKVVIEKMMQGLTRDNDYRKEVKKRMLNSRSATAKVRVKQMENLIYKQCSKMIVTDLNIDRFFLHPSQSNEHILKISEINRLVEIRNDILEKRSISKG
jgi:hypothetical protein